jgi:hypothetical protein
MSLQERHLGGFPTEVDPLKGDEQTSRLSRRRQLSPP